MENDEMIKYRLVDFYFEGGIVEEVAVPRDMLVKELLEEQFD